MCADTATDAGPETQPAPAPATQFSELSIHVAFDVLPIVSYANDSSGKQTVKHGPPFLRFPVSLTAEDAAILKNIFRSTNISLVGFEVKDSDGSSGMYASIVAR